MLIFEGEIGIFLRVQKYSFEGVNVVFRGCLCTNLCEGAKCNF